MCSTLVKVICAFGKMWKAFNDLTGFVWYTRIYYWYRTHTLFHLSCSINESTKYVIATLNCFHDMLTSSNKNPTKVLAFNRNWLCLFLFHKALGGVIGTQDSWLSWEMWMSCIFNLDIIACHQALKPFFGTIKPNH